MATYQILMKTKLIGENKSLTLALHSSIPMGAAQLEERKKLKQKVISPTSSFQLHVGNHKVLAMVDSGAEMNMVMPELAEALCNIYPVNESVKKYLM